MNPVATEHYALQHLLLRLLVVLALIVLAFAGKLLPCVFGALMALVVINSGYDLKVSPKAAFFMLVTMAVVSTVVTNPILRRLVRHAEAL